MCEFIFQNKIPEKKIGKTGKIPLIMNYWQLRS